MMRSVLLAGIVLGLQAPCLWAQGTSISTGSAVASAAGQNSAMQAVASPQNFQITSQNIFSVLEKSFGTVKLDAIRKWTDFAGKMPVEVTERVRVEPGKGFLLDLVNIREVGTTQLDPKLQWRSLRYPQNAGYFYYFRDFRVHDAKRASKNYVARSMGNIQRGTQTLAVYDVLPRVQNRCSYRILVDTTTGLCLDRIEFDATGRVTSTLFYEPLLTRIGAGANKGLNEVKEWWKPWMLVRDFQKLPEAAKTLTFKPRIPTFVDTGFAMQQIPHDADRHAERSVSGADLRRRHRDAHPRAKTRCTRLRKWAGQVRSEGPRATCPCFTTDLARTRSS